MSAQAQNRPHYTRGLLLGLVFGIVLALVGYFAGFELQLFAEGQLAALTTASGSNTATQVTQIAMSNYASSTIFPFLLAGAGLVIGLAFGVYSELRDLL